MSKFIINGGHVTGQCIGDHQTVVQSFSSSETTVTQVTTSFTLSQELRQKLPADKYDQMCKEIQDVINKYTE